MKDRAKCKEQARRKRALRVRRKVKQAGGRPRLSVFKSNRHLYAQIIDDESGRTLAGLGTYSKQLREAGKGRCSCEAGAEIGRGLARKAKELEIEHCVLDRGHCKYHGVIAALTEAAREEGLQI
jgi:large subunit ribosomal protein L18